MIYKPKYTQQAYRYGDTRIRNKFAWLPRRVGDDMVWLESYEIREYYDLREYPLVGTENVAQVYGWVEIGKRIIVKKVNIVQE